MAILIGGVLILGFCVSFAVALAIKYTEDGALCEADEPDGLSNTLGEDE